MASEDAVQTLEVEQQDLSESLRIVARRSPEALERERALLSDAAQSGMAKRWWTYARLSGPGWLQGAMTLGGGTAAASLFAGSLLGYQLLWLQPIAMLTGVIMLNALAYQTLSTGMRPFEAFRQFVHPIAAWGWALAALVASIVWHFPQYNLSAAVVANMAAQAGLDLGSPLRRTGVCAVILVIAILITWNYNKGSRFMRFYENVMKFFVAMIIVSFAAVAINTGIDWARVGSGLLGFHVPWDNPRGMSVMIAAFAAAVGINMTFLLPYSMLARGWGREHRELARFDLSVGLFVPFVMATSFIIIAAANTVHPTYTPGDPVPTPVAFAGVLEQLGFGTFTSHYVFGLGILGMTMSTIPLHMLVCGFIAVEVFKLDPNSWRYRLATLIPTPAFLAPLLWGKLEFWLAVPASVIGGVLLPIAYIGFLVLQNRKDYLGADRPRGAKRIVWNVLLGTIVVVVTAGSLYVTVSKVIEWAGKWG